MPRKTYPVATIADTANALLALTGSTMPGSTPEEDAAFREGVIVMVEAVLHGADQYKGYRFLPSETLNNGALRIDYDDTRRQYYL